MHDLEAMRALLADVRASTPVVRQKTFFSIGGRGHWENPASDVLAFFLNPHEEHGFGPLFLRVFFGCMGVKTGGLSLDTNVQVRVEERLESDERIDLVLRASDWVLAIENKIYHWAANDFDAYARHVRRIADTGQSVHLAVLAPEHLKVPGDWKTVTYRDLCEALRNAFDATFPSLPPSNWQVFAREFATHLQNLLYPVRMKLDPAQLALVEGNLAQIQTLRRYLAAYDEFLVAELQNRLAQTLPEHPPFIFNVESWALVCNAPNGGKWRLAFLTPVNDHAGNPGRQFCAGVCLMRGASDALLQRARREFADLKNFYEGGEWWESFHDDLEGAVARLCEIARRLFGPESAVSTA